MSSAPLRGRQGEPHSKPIKINLDDLSIKNAPSTQPAEYRAPARGSMAKLKAMYQTLRELGSTRGQTESQFIAKMREIERKYPAAE
ncbi:hypothetical protein G6L94_09305 [Agrobacterium rhizogenes]|nr:hypothetical protein [Rhizobium rhizogenes]NTI93880.1 hypothetical protein [Rhizobium rhizogenes]NTJ56347.1 hypothetical protein [Rhizobium rhizogenes]OCJ31260.1 hypothetical protein A6U89_02370 [Agrobacterium sp. B133/95]